MRKLYYTGLESYEARYILQLTEWNRRFFDHLPNVPAAMLVAA